MPDFTNRRRYGVNGFVRLTGQEYVQLTAELGEDETAKCISFMDYMAAHDRVSVSNADWAREIRRCSAEKRYIKALMEGQT